MRVLLPLLLILTTCCIPTSQIEAVQAKDAQSANTIILFERGMRQGFLEKVGGTLPNGKQS